MNKLINGITKKTWIACFLFVLSIICAFFIIQNISGFGAGFNRFLAIANPFVIGIIIAYILNIPLSALMKFLGGRKNKFIAKNSKGLSILIIYITIIFIIYLLLSIIVPNLINALAGFKNNMPVYNESISNLIGQINEKFNLQIKMGNIFDIGKLFNPAAVVNYLKGAMGISSALLNFALAFIVSIYFLVEKDNVIRYLKKLSAIIFKTRTHNLINKYAHQLNVNFHTFIFCQTIDGCILGTAGTIALNIIGVKYAMILGPFLGFADIIPYFGSIIGTFIVVIMVMITDNVQLGIVSLIVLMILQQLDGNIVQPKLLGSKLKLSPLLIIISITIGGAYGGVGGMIVAIPLVAVAKNMLDDFMAYREKSKTEIVEKKS